WECQMRYLSRDRRERLVLGEADAYDEVVPLACERAQVRDVVGRRLRLDDARLDAELAPGALEPDISEMVEAAVVQTADVGAEADLEGPARPVGRRRRGRRVARGLVARSAAGRDD